MGQIPSPKSGRDGQKRPFLGLDRPTLDLFRSGLVNFDHFFDQN